MADQRSNLPRLRELYEKLSKETKEGKTPKEPTSLQFLRTHAKG